MSNDYFIRCIESKVPKLMALAVGLGLLKESSETPGQYYEAMRGVAWCPIGRLYQPIVDQETPAPISDASGEAYFHANIRVPFDSLLEYAHEVYAANPSEELGAGLATMGDYFLLTPEGEQRRPAVPAAVFA
jgi:hypothetical protein